jgi:hypothetical protein
MPQEKPSLFPDDPHFWFQTLLDIAADEYGGSQVGEVLAVGARIKPGDYDGWHAPGMPSPIGSPARLMTSFAGATRSARATGICAPPTTIVRPSSTLTETRAIRASPAPTGEAWTAKNLGRAV